MTSAAVRELRGLPASGGIVAGTCFRPTNAAPIRKQGSVEEESDAFEQAVAESIRQISQLAGNSDELGAAILEFQEMLLDDDEILEPVRKRIAAGMSADSAWSEALKIEIDDYASSDSEYMAARASDLSDLRERVLKAMSTESGRAPEPTLGDVIVADDIGPSVLIDWADRNIAAGVALGAGSATAHAAIVARSKGVPMAVGIRGLEDIRNGAAMLLDGDAGSVVIGGPESLAEIRNSRMAKVEEARRIEAEFSTKRARTAVGKPINVLLNVENPDDLEKLNPEICEGIGLFRTEFLFMGEDMLPSEEVQFNAYRRAVEWADGRPVTIRTLDAGGDKPVAGLTVESETNPFLGVRGLRLSLANPEPFRVQLRAISRVAVLGPVKSMLPMVTEPSEFAEAEKHLDEVLKDLEAEGIDCAKPALGIMVETPAAALTAADWPAEFYSIGSNDLVQYVTACARDNPRVAGLADPASPAVLELIGRTVAAGKARGVEVSLCGEMASDPKHVHSLLDVGLETLSVTAAYAGRVKHAISTFDGGP